MMIRRFAGMATLVSLTALSAGCVQEARIAMPAQVTAETEQIELTGMGGWERGRFRLGGSEGQFTRRLIRSAGILGMQNRGSSSFSAEGPEFGAPAEGRCSFREREIGDSSFSIPIQRLAYGCIFWRGGQPLPGELLLNEVPRGSGLLAGRSRAGTYRMGDMTVEISAIHDMQGGGLPTGSPLGYAFHLDGRQIGAIDLNGSNKTIYAPREAGNARDAVLMASLALATWWDPGDND